MALLDKITLFDYLKDNKELKKINQGKDIHVSSCEALALLTALSFNEKPRKMFFLFPTIYEAESFSQFLCDYIKEDSTFIFPYDEIFRTSAIGVSPEMNEERLLAVSSIFSDKPSILISHISACSTLISSKEQYVSNIKKIKTGDFFIKDEFLKYLSLIGYQYVDSITSYNQFTHRGGIVDFFDSSYTSPIRIEFFGDEIDDIRFFNISNEISFQHINEIDVHPSSLKLLNEEEINEGILKIENELKSSLNNITNRLDYTELSNAISDVVSQAKLGYLNEINARFFSFFKDEENTLLSYLDSYEKYIYEPTVCISVQKDIKKKEHEYFNEVIKDGHSLNGEKVYSLADIDFTSFKTATYEQDDSFVIRENSFKSLSYSESPFLISEYLKEKDKIRIVLPQPNLSNYDNFLTEKGIEHTLYPKHSQIMLIEGRITHGYEIFGTNHVYLSAKEIFGVTEQKSRFLSRYKEAKIIRKYEELKEGDYVVHEVHGVGKYVGVETIDGLEYLKIQYANEASFYLPLSQYRLIRKYSSREGYTPSLDKLGGSTWSRKKAKIRSRISYLADQLLALYAERQNIQGYQFKNEDELERDFINSFPYPYTESQLEAISDIKSDMESSHPMDRLIAGDVGFGKTEIAFFAAFKAILEHKQVVLLCPTTILSSQHYKVACKRFDSFGIKVELFNRFVSQKKQNEIISSLKEGKVDMVIGTHALLSESIVFKDLGLLIIDEEQKFGVAHKEKIKEKTRNVDCLTLTATPIPRTMQMSLLGVRSMSILSKPPMNRMPVKTYVAKQDNELIYEVIDRELSRKGQVYYLHNNISTINELANKLQKKFSSFHVGVVHAKLSIETIEEIMNKFYQCEIDILVCTSIIESGLDIPNVNTIIVENADHFGLSQLYQIKGRVGRSDRLAYAYFFFKDEKKMTDDGVKRLKALKDFTELGSGYKIAMQDLNIRGAGDILGSEQAGFVDSLGYDAYMDLLQSVIKEKKLADKAVLDLNKNDFQLSFSLDAHIPSSYGNEAQRITMYKELSDCNSEKEIEAFAKKIKDVYGPYTEEVGNLLKKRRIEIYLNSNLYSGFVENLGSYQITMSEFFSSKKQIFKKFDETLQPLAVKLRVKVTSSHLFEFVLTKTKEYLDDLLTLVEKLDIIYYDR